MKKIIILVALMFSFLGYSQELIWTGNASTNDFFDENNWEHSSTNLAPTSGSIDAEQPINIALQLHNASALVIANGVINLGTGSLSITDSSLEATAFSSGNVSISNEGYVDLSDTNPLQNNVSINFTSGISWLRTINLKGDIVLNNYLSQIKVNSATAIYQTNLRLDNYYLEGTVIRSNDLSTVPLIIYDDSNLQGTSGNISVDIVHSGQAISNNMNNKTESFMLKKGFMATFAIDEDGTNKSKNYIASTEDLIINELPSYLLNKISFIRVIPWNWVTKKGIGGNTAGLDNGWFYRWNNNGASSIDIEYVPMSWGFGGANDDNDIELYKSKYKATHVLAFNESDNCEDQSGQYNNLCDTDVAVSTYKNLMKTGLRLVSPSGRENAPFGWLKEFYDKANAQDIRIDVIGVHWYDWASSPENSPNADPNLVFNRFKNYLQRVYDLYGLPIWITEFNANPNRSNATNYEFMQLALPYLETLEYVERYAWFQPNSGTADYYDASNTNLTNVGNFYKNQLSTPSVAKATLSEDNNLDIYYNLMGSSENLLVNGFFETEDLTGWTGTNIGILSNANTYEGTTSGRILAGAGNLQQTVYVAPLATYDLSFYTKWFVSPSEGPISVQILNASTNEIIASKLMTTNTNWNLINLSFTVPAGVTSIKFSVDKKTGTPGWFIDNALLIKSESLAISNFDVNAFNMYPNPTSGVSTIKTKTPIHSYAIYNLQGQLIEKAANLNLLKLAINLTNKTKGVYIISIEDHNGKQSSNKLILN
ncbi:glycosyl hydrolase [Polaribacter sp. Hel_I_88]|uniref:glycosyl hydrolase n=1 Tax=Polaribacter sp. Hel_I_88 TaxID=1250006 RepID=UPI00068D7261|nr:glycosyl hydrolase [Polaribacter sp. Hel_I_88]